MDCGCACVYLGVSQPGHDCLKVVARKLRLLGTDELPVNISPRIPLSSQPDYLQEPKYATSVFPSDHFGVAAEILLT